MRTALPRPQPTDLAPRLPVAIASVLFLAFFYASLRREFGRSAAMYATAILGTSAGWVAFSEIGVTDLPMSAAFAASMLLLLRWTREGGRRLAAGAAALLGLAVLAKGLVPLVLALPALWMARRRWRELLNPLPALVFLVVAAPWLAALLLLITGGSIIITRRFKSFQNSKVKIQK